MSLRLADSRTGYCPAMLFDAARSRIWLLPSKAELLTAFRKARDPGADGPLTADTLGLVGAGQGPGEKEIRPPLGP